MPASVCHSSSIGTHIRKPFKKLDYRDNHFMKPNGTYPAEGSKPRSVKQHNPEEFFRRFVRQLWTGKEYYTTAYVYIRITHQD